MRNLLRPNLLLAVAVSAALACPSGSAAQSVWYGEAEVPVSSIEPLDGGRLVAVSLGGETRIFSEPEVGRAVVARYFALSAVGSGLPALQSETLVKVLRHAAKSGDTEVARRAIRAALEGQSDGNSDEAQMAICAELLAVAPQDALREERAACSRQAIAHAQQLAERGLFSEAFALAEIGSRAAPASEPLLAARAALEAAARGDSASLFQELQRAGAAGIALERALAREALRVAVARSDRALALEILGRSEFESRSTTEHDAVRWVLEGLPDGALRGARAQQACRTLRLYAQKDESVSELLGDGCRESQLLNWLDALASLLVLLTAAALAWWLVRRRKAREKDRAGEVLVSPGINSADAERAWHLSFFNLPASATTREIKVAYRKLIKSLHPDRVGGAQRGAASAEFIEATQRYERLLRMQPRGDAGGSEQMH